MTAKTHSTTAERLLERAYDAERAGQPLEAARLRTLSKDAAALVDTADPILAAARWLDTHKPSDRYEPFGALSDGTPIMATVDPVEPSGLVRTTFNNWRLFAQDDPDLFTIYGDGFNLEDLTRDQIGTMRALFTGDIPEQLLASAAAHGRGDVAPPTFAGSGCPVRVERWGDKEGSAYTDLIIGDGLTKVLIGTHGGDKSGIELIIGGNCINDKLDEVLTLDDVRQLRDNLTALIEDGRLVAHLEAGASPLCAPPDVRQPSASRPQYPDGEYIDPIETPLGKVGNIACERIDMSPDRVWLSFQGGIAQIDVNILGGQPGADLLINGHQINEGKPGMMRAQLEQTRDALIDLLEDTRLLATLAEQPTA